MTTSLVKKIQSYLKSTSILSSRLDKQEKKATTATGNKKEETTITITDGRNNRNTSTKSIELPSLKSVWFSPNRWQGNGKNESASGGIRGNKRITTNVVTESSLSFFLPHLRQITDILTRKNNDGGRWLGQESCLYDQSQIKTQELTRQMIETKTRIQPL